MATVSTASGQHSMTEQHFTPGADDLPSYVQASDGGPYTWDCWVVSRSDDREADYERGRRYAADAFKSGRMFGNSSLMCFVLASMIRRNEFDALERGFVCRVAESATAGGARDDFIPEYIEILVHMGHGDVEDVDLVADIAAAAYRGSLH